MTSKTPGYNVRLSIRFSADKHGRPLAHYWSNSTFGGGRWIRLGYDEARLFVSQQQADTVQA